MLEFKFRAWHKPTRAMISWENLSKLMEGIDIWVSKTLSREARDQRMVPGVTILRHGNPFSNPDFVMMQSIGHKDADGREIYEEDQVINLNQAGQVVATMKRRDLMAGPAIVFDPGPGIAIRHWMDARLLIVGHTFQGLPREV